MRELQFNEIEAVSGAGFFDAITSAILGATGYGVAGAIIGGQHGGDGGGILGVGAIGQLVGMIGGGLIGVVAGAVGGALVGWNDSATVTALFTDLIGNISSGAFFESK